MHLPYVTLFHFATLCPLCRLRKVDKLYKTEDFILYMAVVAYDILKDVKKGHLGAHFYT